MSKQHSLNIEAGKRVGYNSTIYRIAEILSLSTVQLVDEIDHNVITAEISKLEIPRPETPLRPDMNTINEQVWKLAKSRLTAIKPLLNIPNRTRATVTEIAEKQGVSTNTLYSWLKAYEATGLLSSLLPKTRSDKGATRISEEVEEIIKETIATEYLTKQKKSKQIVYTEVARRCAKLGLAPPHVNTVRNRIFRSPLKTLKKKEKEKNPQTTNSDRTKALFPVPTGRFP